MIRGLWFFAQLAVLVLAAVWLAVQPGSVSIEWRSWLVETTPGVLIFSVLVVAAVLIVLWRVWRGVRSAPHLIDRFRRHRRRAHGHAALVHALSAIAAGDGAAALSYANEAEDIAEPAFAHLTAARAAELAGDATRAQAEYEKLRERPDTMAVGLKGLISLADRRGQTQEALELARVARKAMPKNPWVARRLFELERRLGAHAEAERTLGEAAKLGALTGAEADRLLAELLIVRAAEAEAGGRGSEALSYAERAHELAPALTEPAVLAARLLARGGRIPAAERVLSRSWALAPNVSIARVWMSLSPADDHAAAIRQSERLIALDRDSAEGRLAIAEVALAAGRWAEARVHLMALQGLTGERYCRLMAFLESGSGNPDAARGWFEKSLAAPISAPPVSAPLARTA